MSNFKFNNKATILPVTIISMFIMMLVAYACIKMFITQNIIATTDQIKIRTRYASEGFAQLHFARIASIIDIINETDDSILDSTEIEHNGVLIKNINSSGSISNVEFPQCFKIDNYEDYFKSEYKMYPDISIDSELYQRIDLFRNNIGKFTGNDIYNLYWEKDTGLLYYKRSDPDILTDLGTSYDVSGLQLQRYRMYNGYSNTGYIKADKLVNIYSNNSFYAGIDSMPRQFKPKNTYLYFFNCGTNSNLINQNSKYEYNSTENINGVKNYIFQCEEKEERCDDINSVLSGSSALQNAKNNIQTYIKNHCTGATGSVYMTAVLIRYDVKNSSQGYVIETTARSNASGKLSSISCTTKLFFDIFMSKLYRNIGEAKRWRCDWTRTVNTGGSIEWTFGWPLEESFNTASKYEFVNDNTKYINNIKYRIQKWEVIP